MDISIKSTAPGLDPMAQRTRPGVAAQTENRGAAGRTEVAARPAETAPTRSAATTATPQRVEHENKARPAEPTREQALSALNRQAYASRLENAPEMIRTEEAERTRTAEARPGEAAEKPAWVTELLKDFRLAMGTDNAKFDYNGDGRVGKEDLEILMTRLSDYFPGAAPPEGEPPKSGMGEKIQALIDAWGSDDPAFDLNGDGQVNIFDLLAILDGKTEAGETNAGETAAGAGSVSMDLQSVLSALGSSDPTYDLDGDGKVDIHDLLAYVNQNAAGPGKDADQSNPGSNGNAEAIQSLLDAWGTDHPAFDLTGKGKIDVFDLLALLDGQSAKA